MRHDVIRFSLVRAVLSAILVVATAQNGLAVEGGQGHYPLGFAGWQAGLVPPEAGTYFKNYTRFYDGKARAEVRGGEIALGLDQSSFLEILSFTHVTNYQLLGGDVFGSLFVPFTNANVSGTLETPLGNFFREESASGYTDMSVVGGLGWHTEKLHWNFVTTVYMPTGNFDTGALAYTGMGYWTVEPAVGFTYLNMENGRQISLFAALDFNSQNPQTDYKSGDEFHLDFLLAQHLGEKFAVGLTGYYYDQLTNDSGAGALLGGYQGQAVALGPALQYATKLRGHDLSAEFKYFREFDVRNRFRGNNYWFNLAYAF